MVNAGLLSHERHISPKKENKESILHHEIIIMTIKHIFKFKISHLNSEQQIIPMINT